MTKDTKKNDEFLKREIPLQGKITITGRHSHVVDNFQALGFLRISPESKDEISGYFKDGYGPAAAMQAINDKMKLEDDYETMFCDASRNPKPRTVYHLYEKWLLSEYGKMWSSKEPLERLKEKLEDYKKQGKLLQNF